MSTSLWFSRHNAARLIRMLGISFAYCCIALARPVVLEEVAQITSPDPAHPFTNAVAVHGNGIFVVARFHPLRVDKRPSFGGRLR